MIEYGSIRLINEPAEVDPGVRGTQAIDALLLGDGRDIGAGRNGLPSARRTYTTKPVASRLRGNAVGLAPFETGSIGCETGRPMLVTATPVHHDASDEVCVSECDVIGFALGVDKPGDLLYVMGGGASWHDGIADVADRFSPKAVLLFSAQAGASGRMHVPLRQDDAIRVASMFPRSTLVAIRDREAASQRPCREPVALALSKLGIADRLRFFTKGRPLSID
ncbi:hypothetical protein [Burkholderia sp. 3C]